MSVLIFHLLCHFRSLFVTRSSGRPTTRPPSMITLLLSGNLNSNVLPFLAVFFSRPPLSNVKRFLLSSIIRPLRPCLLYTSPSPRDVHLSIRRQRQMCIRDSLNSNVLPFLAVFFSRPPLSNVKRFLLSSIIRPLRPTLSLLVLFTTVAYRPISS